MQIFFSKNYMIPLFFRNSLIASFITWLRLGNSLSSADSNSNSILNAIVRLVADFLRPAPLRAPPRPSFFLTISSISKKVLYLHTPRLREGRGFALPGGGWLIVLNDYSPVPNSDAESNLFASHLYWFLVERCGRTPGPQPLAPPRSPPGLFCTTKIATIFEFANIFIKKIPIFFADAIRRLL